MELEAFQGSALRYRALFTLDRFNRYSLTLPAALGTHGLRVRVFQYWAGAPRRPAQHLSRRTGSSDRRLTRGPRPASAHSALRNSATNVSARIFRSRPERPVGDVVVVPLHALGERGLPAQAVHLRPAGDARLDAVAVAVAGDVLPEQLDELRALGARAR